MTGQCDALAAKIARLSEQLSALTPEMTQIATTPKDLVWQDGKTRLYRYQPQKSLRMGPLLIVHGLIGRHTMVDLEPERSLVVKLLAAGVDVWVVDWGNASLADRNRTFADFAGAGLGRAIDALLAESGAERCALMGICQGGTFALSHAALFPERLAGVALAIAPVDFHADENDPNGAHGYLNLWLRRMPREVIEAFLEEHGNLPGRLTGAVFQNLMPARTLAKYTTGLLALADDRDRLITFLRMERWLADRPDHPGAAARDWLIALYQENRLARGTFELDGRRVDLQAVTCPVLNIYGTADHIVPPPCSTALVGLLPDGHDYQEVAVPSGHVGVFVSKKAAGIVPPSIIGWLARIS